MLFFADRRDAGERLAAVIGPLEIDKPIVLGLPRGGVVVAEPVAERLSAPLDVWVTKKIGAPTSDEVGIGAVGEGGEVFIDAAIARSTGADRAFVERVVATKRREVAERVQRLRRGRARPSLAGRTVIVVDDGVANGVTARCAVRDLRRNGALLVMLAVPVGATDSMQRIERECDGVVCLGPLGFVGSVGSHYDDFAQTTDDDVAAILARASRRSLRDGEDRDAIEPG